MRDSFGRNIDYLRISLTDRCNLACRYCTAGEGGGESAPSVRATDVTGPAEKSGAGETGPGSDGGFCRKEGYLTREEILRLASLLVKSGIKRIRLTGGEPLIRHDTPELVSSLKKLEGLKDVSLTTNGVLLPEYARALKRAGIGSINISLDTCDEETFEMITGRYMLREVQKGIEAVMEAGIDYKINCVPMRGINEKDLPDIAAMARDGTGPVRFIELMPIGCGRSYEMIPADEVLHTLEAVYGSAKKLSGKKEDLCRGPAVYYRFRGFREKVGLISAMSESFCSGCNRIRLTSDGFLKLCLGHSAGVDLRGPMRDGAGDGELCKLIKGAVMKKPAEHGFITGSEDPETKRMIRIGG